MEVTSGESPARTVDWMQVSRNELVERLARTVRDDGAMEPLDGLVLYRASAPTQLGHGVSDISFCMIAQGSKDVLLGNHRLHYSPAEYLISSLALPIASRVMTASQGRPYLGIVIKLEPALVSSVLVEAGQLASYGRTDVTAIDVSPLDAGLLDTVVRLVKLLDSPLDAAYLAPLAKRELVYRLLRGEQGARLRHIASLDSAIHPIAAAIERLRIDFNQPLRIEAIARELGMSVSGFHHQFKAITAMSPLQFLKQLRLQEARRLMLGEGLDAASAGYRAGYGDASHFTRDYKRLFGAPPMHDVEQLRRVVRESTVL